MACSVHAGTLMKLIRAILYLVCILLIVLALLLLVSDLGGDVPEVVYAEGALAEKAINRIFT